MSSQRKINFNAGPAAMPVEVLQEASQAVIEYNNTGLSILELPHRGKEFDAILEESKQLVRELCGLNNDYEVLWLQGGGRLQFCMIPMNFLGQDDAAGYIDSGHWADEALSYATHYGDVQVLASSRTTKYDRLPAWPKDIPAQLKYVHYTTNNTIYGTQMHDLPTCNVPLVADMSSDLFSARRDYSKCSLFYAAVQKNLGPAGTTLVVLHKDMLQRIKRTLPPMLSYAAQVKENSVLNTANVFGIYSCLLMLRWTKKTGIDTIEKNNRTKAAMLYDVIDSSAAYNAVVKTKADRSLMNVCFTAATPAIEKALLDQCAASNITGIKGHRSVGGFRASLYNAVSVEDVVKLVEVMREVGKGD